MTKEQVLVRVVDRSEVMQSMYDEGMTFAQIAAEFGVSKQRVGQLIGPQRKKAHYGGARKSRMLEERTAAFNRIQAGESTLEEEAEKIDVTAKTLYQYLVDHKMFLPTQFTLSPKHGTGYRYNRGCRCPRCRKAAKDLRLRRTERGPTKHGTVSAYVNYGCRCDECRAAGSANNRAIRDRRQRREAEQNVEQG